MPTLLIGLLALALMLWLVKSFARSDPQYMIMILTRIGRVAGGMLMLSAAGVLLMRGELIVALPLGLFALGMLGWEPARDLLGGYFDRRPPGWREPAQGNERPERPGGPAPSGRMTEQEAYQILGLQPGATADDIVRAHRGLIKKLHPDQGGSTYLAARVNEAKDVLLRRHQ